MADERAAEFQSAALRGAGQEADREMDTMLEAIAGQPVNQTTDYLKPSDEAARIIGRLIILVPEQDRDSSAVSDAIMWLRKHDHPGMWVADSVRRVMEATNE